MIKEGRIVLFPFPQTDRTTGKLRPALVLRRCPGPHDDWLICMISSQLRHEIPGVDTILHPDDADFAQTGLKLPSVIRVTRLAVVASSMLQGAIGSMPNRRLNRIRQSIADWISGVHSLLPAPSVET
uniref:mRNA interferase MazF n=1 Tax=Candidatus Kentrum sp. MB TaxID=2138164 RepID=A0A451B770_9GAMM|nr:MAG: mRNA interferase MazF [Candidatus Kentron sp. MB]VFK28835.1 MAG: mRNA interferase MazF [Candidatus Kentron sp. MB]VFK74116.1 MAG: mRNA interferase MazF [Candidatus Kentron sp. MB]